MGTGILSTLLGHRTQALPWLIVPAAGLLLIGFVLLIFLTVGMIAHWNRVDHPTNNDIRHLPTVDPAWGQVSMGYLSIGSATLTVCPQIGLGAAAVPVDTALWWIGTIIGLTTSFAFVSHAMLRQLGEPRPAWGLAAVGPMVSATTGATLLMSYHSAGLQFTMLTLSFLCFVSALVNAIAIFTLAYLTHAQIGRIPIALAITSWIPLGVVGQSIAAAVSIEKASELFLVPTFYPYAVSITEDYGLVMNLIAIPVVGFAIRETIKGFKNNIPFSPTWWALTFPIGTLALGGELLGGLLGVQNSLLALPVSIIGIAALVTLCCTWLFCSGATVWALKTGPRKAQVLAAA